jgi:hypothetical protein
VELPKASNVSFPMTHLGLIADSPIIGITKRWNWKEERAKAENPNFPNVAYEDQWYYKKMMELNREGSWRHAGGTKERLETVRLPTPDQAMRFSVETMWYDKPLGYHQVASWNLDRIKEIDAWCPEHRMTSDEKLRNAGE